MTCRLWRGWTRFDSDESVAGGQVIPAIEASSKPGKAKGRPQSDASYGCLSASRRRSRTSSGTGFGAAIWRRIASSR